MGDCGDFEKRMECSSVTEAMLRLSAGKFRALRSHCGHRSREGPIPFAHIDQRQHGVGAVGVLRQTAIACFGKAPQALEGQERMLDLGALRVALPCTSNPFAVANVICFTLKHLPFAFVLRPRRRGLVQSFLK